MQALMQALSYKDVIESLEYHLTSEIAKTLGFHLYRLHIGIEVDRRAKRIVRLCSLVAKVSGKRLWLGLDMDNAAYEIYTYDGDINYDIYVTKSLADPESLTRPGLRAAIRKAAALKSPTHYRHADTFSVTYPGAE